MVAYPGVRDMAIEKSIIKKIHIKKGDITQENTDVIVNAANPSLLGGGGVDGAIHRAAGPGLLEECKKLGGCNHGEARITGAYKLKSKYVIHTPGPIYRNGHNNESQILRNCYINSLELAIKNGCKSISFPAISTGVYGYPKDEACTVALTSAIDFLMTADYKPEIYFVVYDKDNYTLYNDALQKFAE